MKGKIYLPTSSGSGIVPFRFHSNNVIQKVPDIPTPTPNSIGGHIAVKEKIKNLKTIMEKPKKTGNINFSL